MKKFVLWAFVFVLLICTPFFIQQLITPCSANPEFFNSETESSGVVVRGYCSDGWIKNTNPYPVKVKQVWIFKGERTEWIKTLQPKEIVHQYISHQHGFYVYRNGEEIDYIKPFKNGKG